MHFEVERAPLNESTNSEEEDFKREQPSKRAKQIDFVRERCDRSHVEI